MKQKINSTLITCDCCRNTMTINHVSTEVRPKDLQKALLKTEGWSEEGYSYINEGHEKMGKGILISLEFDFCHINCASQLDKVRAAYIAQAKKEIGL